MPAMSVVAAAWAAASPVTIRYARQVQHVGKFMVGWIKSLAEWWDPRSELTEADISPYFWPNGTMPASTEFDVHVARLPVAGGWAGRRPQEFSLPPTNAPLFQGITVGRVEVCRSDDVLSITLLRGREMAAKESWELTVGGWPTPARQVPERGMV